MPARRSRRAVASKPSLRSSQTSSINCVNVPGTELSSILCTRDGGTVYFFSMATSFTAAALGAEGIGRDVTMIIGNGYTKDHAEIALQTLRDHPDLHAYFNAKYKRKHDMTTPAPSITSSHPHRPEQFEYKNLKQGEFWRHIPAYAEVDEATFLDHLWQPRKSVKTAEELLETIREVCSPEFYRDAEAGFHHAPMAVRVSPYAISLIDWNDPIDDPIRRQFIPLASTALPDHPRLTLDSLHEQEDSPVPGLVHRYVDKALFLPLNVCPVYCRFCTRSYAIGPDTETSTRSRWQDAQAVARSLRLHRGAARARRHRDLRR